MLQVLRAFDREGVDYVLIGAAAMVRHDAEALRRRFDLQED
jgi:hypothetical protein